MAGKRRNLFLYLALACFVGIIAIFVADGYMGVYDTIYVTAGEDEQKIEPDYWLRQGKSWPVRTNWGEKVKFEYEVDNRRFSSYSADVSVSVWRSQEKVRDLVSQHIQVAPVNKGQLEWVVDTEELKPSGFVPEQSYEFSVIIKRGELERRVILHINPSVVPKPIPPPPR